MSWICNENKITIYVCISFLRYNSHLNSKYRKGHYDFSDNIFIKCQHMLNKACMLRRDNTRK